MLDSIEIRVVKNGFIVVVSIDDETEEHIFETQRRLMKFVRDVMITYAPSSKSDAAE